MRMFVNSSKNPAQPMCDRLSFKDVRSFLAGSCPLPPRKEGKSLQLTKAFNLPRFGLVWFVSFSFP